MKHSHLLPSGAVLEGHAEVSEAEVPRLAVRTLLDDDLVDAHQNGHLNEPLKRRGLKTGHTVGQVRELQVRGRGEESLEPVQLLGEDAEDGSHGDATVLDLNTAVVLKVLVGGTIGSVLDQAEGVKVAKRGQCANLLLHIEGREGR